MTTEEKAKRYAEALERAKFCRLLLLNIGEEAIEIEYIFPELQESEDERIRKEIIAFIKRRDRIGCDYDYDKWLTWLEKQCQKPQVDNFGIEPFEAEHGKYYYCIKDYFCGGKKQASKGEVVQALRGLPIMGLKDASEYFLPVNFIKCKSAWSEDDDENIMMIEDRFSDYLDYIREDSSLTKHRKNTIKEEVIGYVNWLKSLKDRVRPQPKQEWSESDKEEFQIAIDTLVEAGQHDSAHWLKSLKKRMEEQQ